MIEYPEQLRRFQSPLTDEVVDEAAQLIFKALDGSEWAGLDEVSKERYRQAAAIVAPMRPLLLGDEDAETLR